jgi:c-di-GMP-related signal transduction protein
LVDINIASARRWTVALLSFRPSIGLENILCGKKAFLNFNQSLLNDGLYLSPPRLAMVIEILESVEPNSGLLALCRRIHDQGYTIALDDFVASPQFEPLTHLAELIKVDVRATSRPEQQRLTSRATFLRDPVSFRAGMCLPPSSTAAVCSANCRNRIWISSAWKP